MIHRIRKRWMTHDVAELCDCRRQAHAEFARNRSAANAAALETASDAAREACKTAQRAYTARRESNAQARWVDNPGSRDAWKLLRDLDKPASTSRVDALVHPNTASLCKNTDGKLHALSSHFQNLMTPTTPRSPLEETQRQRSAARVAALRQHAVGHTQGLYPTTREVQSALGKMHNHKAPGTDGMQAEILKYSGRTGAPADRPVQRCTQSGTHAIRLVRWCDGTPTENWRYHCKKTRPSRAHSQARSGPCLDGWSSALRSAASQLTASKQRTSPLMGLRMTWLTPLTGWSGAMPSFGCPALAHARAVGREGELQDELWAPLPAQMTSTCLFETI